MKGSNRRSLAKNHLHREPLSQRDNSFIHKPNESYHHQHANSTLGDRHTTSQAIQSQAPNTASVVRITHVRAEGDPFPGFQTSKVSDPIQFGARPGFLSPLHSRLQIGAPHSVLLNPRMKSRSRKQLISRDIHSHRVMPFSSLASKRPSPTSASPTTRPNVLDKIPPEQYDQEIRDHPDFEATLRQHERYNEKFRREEGSIPFTASDHFYRHRLLGLSHISTIMLTNTEKEAIAGMMYKNVLYRPQMTAALYDLQLDYYNILPQTLLMSNYLQLFKNSMDIHITPLSNRKPLFYRRRNPLSQIYLSTNRIRLNQLAAITPHLDATTITKTGNALADPLYTPAISESLSDRLMFDNAPTISTGKNHKSLNDSSNSLQEEVNALFQQMKKQSGSNHLINSSDAKHESASTLSPDVPMTTATVRRHEKSISNLLKARSTVLTELSQYLETLIEDYHRHHQVPSNSALAPIQSYIKETLLVQTSNPQLTQGADVSEELSQKVSSVLTILSSIVKDPSPHFHRLLQDQLITGRIQSIGDFYLSSMPDSESYLKLTELYRMVYHRHRYILPPKIYNALFVLTCIESILPQSLLPAADIDRLHRLRSSFRITSKGYVDHRHLEMMYQVRPLHDICLKSLACPQSQIESNRDGELDNPLKSYFRTSESKWLLKPNLDQFAAFFVEPISNAVLSTHITSYSSNMKPFTIMNHHSIPKGLQGCVLTLSDSATQAVMAYIDLGRAAIDRDYAVESFAPFFADIPRDFQIRSVADTFFLPMASPQPQFHYHEACRQLYGKSTDDILVLSPSLKAIGGPMLQTFDDLVKITAFLPMLRYRWLQAVYEGLRYDSMLCHYDDFMKSNPYASLQPPATTPTPPTSFRPPGVMGSRYSRSDSDEEEPSSPSPTIDELFRNSMGDSIDYSDPKQVLPKPVISTVEFIDTIRALSIFHEMQLYNVDASIESYESILRVLARMGWGDISFAILASMPVNKYVLFSSSISTYLHRENIIPAEGRSHIALPRITAESPTAPGSTTPYKITNVGSTFKSNDIAGTDYYYSQVQSSLLTRQFSSIIRAITTSLLQQPHEDLQDLLDGDASASGNPVLPSHRTAQVLTNLLKHPTGLGSVHAFVKPLFLLPSNDSIESFFTSVSHDRFLLPGPNMDFEELTARSRDIDYELENIKTESGSYDQEYVVQLRDEREAVSANAVKVANANLQTALHAVRAHKGAIRIHGLYHSLTERPYLYEDSFVSAQLLESIHRHSHLGNYVNSMVYAKIDMEQKQGKQKALILQVIDELQQSSTTQPATTSPGGDSLSSMTPDEQRQRTLAYQHGLEGYDADLASILQGAEQSEGGNQEAEQLTTSTTTTNTAKMEPTQSQMVSSLLKKQSSSLDTGASIGALRRLRPEFLLAENYFRFDTHFFQQTAPFEVIDGAYPRPQRYHYSTPPTTNMYMLTLEHLLNSGALREAVDLFCRTILRHGYIQQAPPLEQIRYDPALTHVNPYHPHMDPNRSHIDIEPNYHYQNQKEMYNLDNVCQLFFPHALRICVASHDWSTALWLVETMHSKGYQPTRSMYISALELIASHADPRLKESIARRLFQSIKLSGLFASHLFPIDSSIYQATMKSMSSKHSVMQLFYEAVQYSTRPGMAFFLFTRSRLLELGHADIAHHVYSIMRDTFRRLASSLSSKDLHSIEMSRIMRDLQAYRSTGNVDGAINVIETIKTLYRDYYTQRQLERRTINRHIFSFSPAQSSSDEPALSILNTNTPEPKRVSSAQYADLFGAIASLPQIDSRRIHQAFQYFSEALMNDEIDDPYFWINYLSIFQRVQDFAHMNAIFQFYMTLYRFPNFLAFPIPQRFQQQFWTTAAVMDVEKLPLSFDNETLLQFSGQTRTSGDASPKQDISLNTRVILSKYEDISQHVERHHMFNTYMTDLDIEEAVGHYGLRKDIQHGRFRNEDDNDTTGPQSNHTTTSSPRNPSQEWTTLVAASEFKAFEQMSLPYSRLDRRSHQHTCNQYQRYLSVYYLSLQQRAVAVTNEGIIIMEHDNLQLTPIARPSYQQLGIPTLENPFAHPTKEGNTPPVASRIGIDTARDYTFGELHAAESPYSILNHTLLHPSPPTPHLISLGTQGFSHFTPLHAYAMTAFFLEWSRGIEDNANRMTNTSTQLAPMKKFVFKRDDYLISLYNQLHTAARPLPPTAKRVSDVPSSQKAFPIPVKPSTEGQKKRKDDAPPSLAPRGMMMIDKNLFTQYDDSYSLKHDPHSEASDSSSEYLLRLPDEPPSEYFYRLQQRRALKSTDYTSSYFHQRLRNLGELLSHGLAFREQQMMSMCASLFSTGRTGYAIALYRLGIQHHIIRPKYRTIVTETTPTIPSPTRLPPHPADGVGGQAPQSSLDSITPHSSHHMYQQQGMNVIDLSRLDIHYAKVVFREALQNSIDYILMTLTMLREHIALDDDHLSQKMSTEPLTVITGTSDQPDLLLQESILFSFRAEFPDVGSVVMYDALGTICTDNPRIAGQKAAGVSPILASSANTGVLVIPSESLISIAQTIFRSNTTSHLKRRMVELDCSTIVHQKVANYLADTHNPPLSQLLLASPTGVTLPRKNYETFWYNDTPSNQVQPLVSDHSLTVLTLHPDFERREQIRKEFHKQVYKTRMAPRSSNGNDNANTNATAGGRASHGDKSSSTTRTKGNRPHTLPPKSKQHPAPMKSSANQPTSSTRSFSSSLMSAAHFASLTFNDPNGPTCH